MVEMVIETARNLDPIHATLTLSGLDREVASQHHRAAREIGQQMFRDVPHYDEPAFRVAGHYARMAEQGAIDRALHHLIVRNQFLSTDESHNGRDPRNPKNLLHAARVMVNIELGSRFASRLKMLDSVHPDYELHFERTRSIRLKPDERGVNGCPEALWQLLLFKKGQYVGRIGFNFHQEGRHVVASVVTVQGAEGQPGLVNSARKDLKVNFGAYLILQLKSALKDEVHYRGHLNKALKPFQSPHLYRSAYSKGGIMDLF